MRNADDIIDICNKARRLDNIHNNVMCVVI